VKADVSDDSGSFFGNLFGSDADAPEEDTALKPQVPLKPDHPQIFLWAQMVASVENDFRSTVNVIRSSDLIIGGGGLLGSVVSVVKNLVGANPSHIVARAIALKYAKNALLGLLQDADTLLSLGAFDEALQKCPCCLNYFLFLDLTAHNVCRYISAEERAKALEDNDSILRANEGKSNCLRGKERAVRLFYCPRPILLMLMSCVLIRFHSLSCSKTATASSTGNTDWVICSHGGFLAEA
jgi:hypothetical protein